MPPIALPGLSDELGLDFSFFGDGDLSSLVIGFLTNSLMNFEDFPFFNLLLLESPSSISTKLVKDSVWLLDKLLLWPFVGSLPVSLSSLSFFLLDFGRSVFLLSGLWWSPSGVLLLGKEPIGAVMV